MTTLATLKADIADDFARSDLTSSIAEAITRAIEYYQPVRFWFNETRGETWNTVAGQSRYSSVDAPAIPKFVTLDAMFITVAGQKRQLCYVTPEEFELQDDNSASQGEPYCYTYYDITFGLYPVPGDVYTVRPIGHILRDVPASDGETNNVWMTHAYQLIRSRASADVWARKIRNTDMAVLNSQAETNELDRLMSETSRRIATGRIQATTF